MDVATFLMQRKEFAQVDTDVIQAALNRAAAYMGGPDQRTYGAFGTPTALSFADLCQSVLAALALTGQPFGGPVRQQPDGKGSKGTSYFREWEDLRAAATAGVIVAGLAVPCGASVVVP